MRGEGIHVIYSTQALNQHLLVIECILILGKPFLHGHVFTKKTIDQLAKIGGFLSSKIFHNNQICNYRIPHSGYSGGIFWGRKYSQKSNKLLRTTLLNHRNCSWRRFLGTLVLLKTHFRHNFKCC